MIPDSHIDASFSEVKSKLAKHASDAADWRDTCVTYWQKFSGRDVPAYRGPLSF